MPVRNIPIQNRSVAGYFYSYKNAKTIAYESQLEKKCFLMLEFDKDVLSYEEQPLKINTYIPDVLVKKKKDYNLLIEVKYSKEINNMSMKLKNKLEAFQNFCNKKKWEFKVFTENEIIQPYFNNIAFLYRYVKIPIKNENKIFDFILHREKTNIKTLMSNNFDIKEIYSLLAQGKLETNLFKKLNQFSIIKVCYA